MSSPSLLFGPEHLYRHRPHPAHQAAGGACGWYQRGASKADVIVDRYDELGYLSTTFNTMVEETNQSGQPGVPGADHQEGCGDQGTADPDQSPFSIQHPGVCQLDRPYESCG